MKRDEDIEELLNLILLYVPPEPARQLLGDLHRSRASRDNAALRDGLFGLRQALAKRPIGGYALKASTP